MVKNCFLILYSIVQEAISSGLIIFFLIDNHTHFIRLFDLKIIIDYF